MFHKHKFKLEGNTLWCECGKTKEIKCDHKWKVHSEQTIKNINGIFQVMQTLICEKCGAIKSLNITTGQVNN